MLGFEWDAEDAACREAMMLALDEAENGCADPPPPAPPPPTTEPPPPSGHTLHDGAPFLRVSAPWGLLLLQEADASHSALAAARAEIALLREEATLRVYVDWGAGGSCGGARLAVRRAAELIAAAEARAPAPLQLDVRVADASAGLSWGGGSRTLHILAPLRGALPLSKLLAAPSDGTPEPDALLAPCCDERAVVAPPLPRAGPSADRFRCTRAQPELLHLPARGLGVELEFLTLAPRPDVTGCFTKAEELHALIQRLNDKLDERANEGKLDADAREGGHDRLRRLLQRVALWGHEVDDHVAVATPSIAARTIAAYREEAMEEAAALDDAQLVQLLCGGRGTMKSEFTSPPPTAGTLDFADDAAAEIACLMRLVRHLGVGAPAVSASGHSGCSCHVHVNVRNPAAPGSILSCREVLGVFFAWVRFDLVTARFARPWMWREPSMAPLYATGAEFSWQEAAWQQGQRVAAHNSPNAGPATYDVPLFVRGVRQVERAADFATLTEEEKCTRIFGRAAETPASRIGRYCSLNLRRLCSYGTLEFRRFHGTLDEAIIQRWAHFCVSFVERFRVEGRSAIAVLDAAEEDLPTALAAMQLAQERASAEELMREMASHVDPATASYFMRDSGALSLD
ncbi:hypothetical protein AB1Y20_005733 [Prymnesium parvum]|uniref:Uncharacterized protein n=1 Tax=Prymnesium parvum TaxID=97485 RepID=A0AB34J0F6_PRYPA